MKFVLILATALVAASAVPHPRMVQHEWNSFKSKYVKVYNNADEEAKRSAVFHQNLIKIEEHNKLYEQGLTTFKMGVTQFADMTSEEFMAYVNISGVQSPPQVLDEKVVSPNVNGLPKSIDWRTKNVITPVKDQGKTCKSGWAFSTTGAMEAQYAMKTGKLISLSEQQLIDCQGSEAIPGCSSGSVPWAMRYAMFHNMSYEDSYPYEAKDGKCHQAKTSPVRVLGPVPAGPDRPSTFKGIANNPLAASVHVTPNWHLYKGGVLIDHLCDPHKVNHAVLVVGYHLDHAYYIMKNSWGSDWGERGYIRLSFTYPCGVEGNAYYPELV